MGFPSHYPSLWTNTNMVITMITWGWPNTLLPWNHRTLPSPRHQWPRQLLIDSAEPELKLQRREISFSAPAALTSFVFIVLCLPSVMLPVTLKEWKAQTFWLQREGGRQSGLAVSRARPGVPGFRSVAQPFSCWTWEGEKSQTPWPWVYRFS